MTADARTKTFVDLSTARIHGYLSRSNTLRYIRGGSMLLAVASDEENVESWIADTFPCGCVSICEEAGEAESIIHLEVDTTAESTSCSCDPAGVAREGLEMLRTMVPAADFRADWGTGENYSDFVRQAPERLEFFATVPELPMLVQCNECRRGYAGADGVCIDCSSRREQADRGTGHGPERRLIRRTKRPNDADYTMSRDFNQLAGIGPSRVVADSEAGNRKRNHLATVYIDGNGFRAMFSAAGRDAAPEGFDVGELSREIGTATWRAMGAATAVVAELHEKLAEAESSRVMPVVPHVVAADDVCVSLPAAYAWPFAITFCNAFAKEARSVVKCAGKEWLARQPAKTLDDLFQTVPPATASAGIAIANRSEPFWFTLELAESLLKTAKRVVSGEQPMIMWADVTSDGAAAPPSRQPVSVDEMPVGLLDDLCQMNKTARRNLLDDATSGSGAAADRLTSRIRRLGHSEQLKSVATDPPRFHDLLSIAEWWTPWSR